MFCHSSLVYVFVSLSHLVVKKCLTIRSLFVVSVHFTVGSLNKLWVCWRFTWITVNYFPWIKICANRPTLTCRQDVSLCCCTQNEAISLVDTLVCIIIFITAILILLFWAMVIILHVGAFIESNRCCIKRSSFLTLEEEEERHSLKFKGTDWLTDFFAHLSISISDFRQELTEPRAVRMCKMLLFPPRDQCAVYCTC